MGAGVVSTPAKIGLHGSLRHCSAAVVTVRPGGLGTVDSVLREPLHMHTVAEPECHGGVFDLLADLWVLDHEELGEDQRLLAAGAADHPLELRRAGRAEDEVDGDPAAGVLDQREIRVGA